MVQKRNRFESTVAGKKTEKLVTPPDEKRTSTLADRRANKQKGEEMLMITAK